MWTGRTDGSASTGKARPGPSRRAIPTLRYSMLFSLAMYPIGGTDELADPVSQVVEEIDRAGLDYQVTGMDTVIEGDFDDVWPVVR